LFSPAEQGEEGEKTSARVDGVSCALPTAESLIELLLEVRAKARDDKQFETADLVRARLRELGIRVDDLREGQRWKCVGPAE
jgi:cysteinyl-tRNA synthetase